MVDTPPPTAGPCDDDERTPVHRARLNLDDTVTLKGQDLSDEECAELDRKERRINLELRRMERSAKSLRLQREGIMSEKFARRMSDKKPMFSKREPTGSRADVDDGPTGQDASTDESDEDDDEAEEEAVHDSLIDSERSRGKKGQRAVRQTSSIKRVTTRKYKKLMIPKEYDGTSLLSLFLIQFESCADYNNWDRCDKAAYLRNSLKGSAAHILEDGNGVNASYRGLVERLKNRYGTEGQAPLFKMQLKSRKRGKNEPLATLYHDIRRLSIQAYPGLTLAQLDPFAVESFISALGDRELELRVRDKEPDSLDKAFQITMTAEANAKIYDSSDARGGDDDDRKCKRDNADHARVVQAVDKDKSKGPSEVSAEKLCSLLETWLKAGIGPPGVPPATMMYMPQYNDVQPQMMTQTAEVSSQPQYYDNRGGPGTGSPNYKRNDQGPNQRGYRQPGSDRPPPTCWNCGVLGHYSRTCTQTRKEGPSPTNSPVNSGTVSHIVIGRIGGTSGPVYLDASIRGKPVLCLVDTGCEKSVIPRSIVAGEPLESPKYKLFAANKSEISAYGEVDVKLRFGSLDVPSHFIVSESVEGIILGIDWIRVNVDKWSFASDCITVWGRPFILRHADHERKYCVNNNCATIRGEACKRKCTGTVTDEDVTQSSEGSTAESDVNDDDVPANNGEPQLASRVVDNKADAISIDEVLSGNDAAREPQLANETDDRKSDVDLIEEALLIEDVDGVPQLVLENN